MKKGEKKYVAPVVEIAIVVMEEGIAQVPISVTAFVDPWDEDPNVVGGIPNDEGGDFYVFY